LSVEKLGLVADEMSNEERKGSQSSIGYSRSIEKAFEDSEHCGKLDLGGHKLTRLPDFAGDYELDNLIFVGGIGYFIVKYCRYY